MAVRIAGSAKCWVIIVLLTTLLACGGGSGTKTLYVVGIGTTQVAQFNVASSGVLTLARPIAVGAAPVGVVVTPDLRYAYVLDSAVGTPAGAVSQFTVTRSNGNLTAQTESTDISITTGTGLPVPPIPVGFTPAAIAVDSGGKFVFVANQGDDTITALSIDRSTGALTVVNRPGCVPTPTITCPFPVAHDPTTGPHGPSAMAIHGNTLFVANIAGGISVFTFDNKTGVLTQASGSPFVSTINFCSPSTDPTTGAFMPCSIDLDPTGKFLFVPNKAANQLVELSVQNSGALTPVNSFATGTTPVAVRVHRSGKFVYVANWGTGDVSIFGADASGMLTPVLGSPFPSGANPSFILNDSSGKFLFVANAGSGNVSAFSVNAKTGTLAPAAGSPFLSVGGAMGLATVN